jgi:hypothetical protein
MVYVDLNPIRAGIAATPEESEFTSIYEWIKELKPQNARASEPESAAPVAAVKPPLWAFRSATQATAASIPFTLKDYMTLVDWTGRARREDKRGAIDAQLPAIMYRLNLNTDAWRLAMQPRGNVFGRALGQLDHLRLHARTLGQSWVRGLRQAEQIYRNA